MAKGKKSPSPEESNNDSDVDVLDPPGRESSGSPVTKISTEKIDSAWALGEDPNPQPAPEPGKKEKEQPTDKGAAPKAEPEKKDQEEELEEGPKPQGTPASLLDAMTSGEDNDFSLDEAPAKKEGEKDTPKDKEKISDSPELISRIAKEFNISDAQTTEQLISSIKEKMSTASAGATAPVAGIDKILALPNRDLYKSWLIHKHKLTEEKAEKYITDSVDMNAEGWLDLQAEPLRLDLISTREDIMQNHIAREMAEQKKATDFTRQVRESAKEIKTIFGKIPLKKHVPKIKEYLAKISTDEGLNALRNDPKKLAEAMFVLEFGGDILNTFLEDKLTEKGAETWQKFYNSEIRDKLLHRSKVREQTELPNESVKPGEFKPGSWD